VQWGERRTGLTLFYGSVGDNSTTFKKEDSALLYDQPNVLVNEKTDPKAMLLGFASPSYQPPDGSVLLMPGSGYLMRDGVYVSIRAATEKDVLEAAQALRPMP
jgi:hypothetical protein